MRLLSGIDISRIDKMALDTRRAALFQDLQVVANKGHVQRRSVSIDGTACTSLDLSSCPSGLRDEVPLYGVKRSNKVDNSQLVNLGTLPKADGNGYK